MYCTVHQIEGHGLTATCLQDVFHATVIGMIMYCAVACPSVVGSLMCSYVALKVMDIVPTVPMITDLLAAPDRGLTLWHYV